MTIFNQFKNLQYRQIAIYLHHKSINHTNIQKVIDKNNLKTENYELQFITNHEVGTP